MTMHKTAAGKTVDIAALAAKNEKVRAVGNMKVNARGDKIDSSGKVIQSVTERVNDKYNSTIGNKSAQLKKPTVQATQELTADEQELLDDTFTKDDIKGKK